MNISNILQKWFGQNWEIVNWLLSSISVILASAGVFFLIVGIILLTTAKNKESEQEQIRARKKAKNCLWMMGGCFIFPVAWPMALLIAHWTGVGKIFDGVPNPNNLLEVLWVL